MPTDPNIAIPTGASHHWWYILFGIVFVLLGLQIIWWQKFDLPFTDSAPTILRVTGIWALPVGVTIIIAGGFFVVGAWSDSPDFDALLIKGALISPIMILGMCILGQNFSKIFSPQKRRKDGKTKYGV